MSALIKCSVKPFLRRDLFTLFKYNIYSIQNSDIPKSIGCFQSLSVVLQFVLLLLWDYTSLQMTFWHTECIYTLYIWQKIKLCCFAFTYNSSWLFSLINMLNCCSNNSLIPLLPYLAAHYIAFCWHVVFVLTQQNCSAL